MTKKEKEKKIPSLDMNHKGVHGPEVHLDVPGGVDCHGRAAGA